MTAIKKWYWLVLGFFVLVTIGAVTYFAVPKRSTKPHIIIIMADDLGRNDVGFHGSNQIPTPNIDALAYNGIVMDRFYTQYACTPSRAAFLTGNYPMRYGIHGLPIRAGQNRSLPSGVKIMPEYFKKLGYKTHLVGKWHLGAEYRSSTPTRRGFDTHFGYWHGFVGYFDYMAQYEVSDVDLIKGLDLHDGLQPVWSAQGKYATELFTEKSLEVIEKHDSEVPLFLIVAHLAPHTGTNGTELGVPDSTLTDIKYSRIKDPRRRLYADVVNHLDDSVGQIVKKLYDKKMLDNSIILFFSDNGAQTVGIYENAGSNWPLRGVKLSEFEGGVRVAATIFSPLFKKQGYVNKNLIHLTDWLPTFYAIAGGDVKDLGHIDGTNQWDTLSLNATSTRCEILLNINEVDNASAIIAHDGRYKLLEGTYWAGQYDKYYGESGREGIYNTSMVIDSGTNFVLESTTKTCMAIDHMFEMRNQTDLSWCRKVNETPFLDCRNGCLFDLHKDPCETTNIIELEKEIAKGLYQRLHSLAKGLVPQPKEIFDPASNPAYYNNTWCTWLDDDVCFKTPITR